MRNNHIKSKNFIFILFKFNKLFYAEPKFYFSYKAISSTLNLNYPLILRIIYKDPKDCKIRCYHYAFGTHHFTLMKTMNSPTIFRKDYTVPNYLVNTVDMGFDLDPATTTVATRITMVKNLQASSNTIVLYGDQVDLLSIRMNGKLLLKDKRNGYTIVNHAVYIKNAPENVTLEIATRTHPNKNTSLMGLYVSNGNFFTQCEAEGFRKITYFPDRPDVMAKYTVMLRADKKQCPVLLSNGNLIEEGDLPDGRHFAKWEDPFKKPSYLFALVAGTLVCQEEKFTLHSGREVLLQIWVEKGNLDKTQHAMDSLKNSITWDENRFGLSLDLDRFMIVAVGDFNMGAMENKGLNIFNTKYVLANPSIATDADYGNIQAVIGHEYFHNWTGNRVTCRDWFQLSLKEGLTVFRDQEFSADMSGTASGRAACRIEDVRLLRQVQFSEDNGPMAHPVRPERYVEISNFYTVTIYEKGAEVVRMMQTLLGRDGFRKGMDLYFARHDGQAVTCDDFRLAMADANQHDLTQFERWYSQSGTPHVHAKTSYDAAAQTFTLTLKQSCPNTKGQPKKLPFHIPFTIGLLDQHGNDMPVHLVTYANKTSPTTNCVLELMQHEQTFQFMHVTEKPVPSLLRDFSAPIYLHYDYTDDELAHLLKHDSDPFNRWEAGQRLATQRLLSLVKNISTNTTLEVDTLFINALRATLNNADLDPALRALILTLPSESLIAEQSTIIDPHAIHQARQFMRKTLAQALKEDLLRTYQDNATPGDYQPHTTDAAKRSLKNLCLSYLLECKDDEMIRLASDQISTANNMTDHFAALSSLVYTSPDQAKAQLKDFYNKFKQEPLVIDKWFSLQASAPHTTLKHIRKLMQHKAFNMTNPNRTRSLIFSFCAANPTQFHKKDGSGYSFWAEQVIALDKINPQVAARLARTLDHWKKYTPTLQQHMHNALTNIIQTDKLSKDVREIISLALAI